jgi:CheY-like chemotaxis protein
VTQIPPLVRPTALVVHDNAMCRELTACAIRKKGFHVVEAKDDQAPSAEYQAFHALPALNRPFTEAELLTRVGPHARQRANDRDGGPPSRGQRRGRTP